MTTLNDDPLYQELMSQGYSVGTNRDGIPDALYILNKNSSEKNLVVTQPTETLLSVIAGLTHNNKSERIVDHGATTSYVVDFALNPLVPLTDRIAINFLDYPTDQPFGYGLDLMLVPGVAKTAFLGFDPNYTGYQPVNTYLCAQAGVFINDEAQYVTESGNPIIGSLIYNTEQNITKSFDVIPLATYRPEIKAYDNAGLYGVFGNQFIQTEGNLSFVLQPMQNPLTNHVRTALSNLNDFRFTDGDFDGWEFGFAFAPGWEDNQEPLFATIRMSYVELFVEGNPRIFYKLYSAIKAKYPEKANQLTRLFSYPGEGGERFSVMEDIPPTTGAGIGPSYTFAGFEVQLGAVDPFFERVILYPDYNFGSPNVMNIARDYSAPVIEGMSHKPYPIYTQALLEFGEV